MQRLEVSGAVRLIYLSLGVKGLKETETKPSALMSVRSIYGTEFVAGFID